MGMLRRVWAIALNTFREAIRNRVLYGVLVVVVGANALALVLAQMSLHEEARVILDVGLAGVSLFGAITAMVLGVSLLYAEIQKKTIHNLLSKPIERHEFVLGKYIGMSITLTILVALFGVVLALLLELASLALDWVDVHFSTTVFKALLLGYFEVQVVAAVAIFFSSFTTPFLSGIFTFAIFIIGRISEEVRMAARASESELARPIIHMVTRIVPDLHLFAASGSEVAGKHVSVHGEFVSWGYVGMAAAHALAWIGLLLLLAVVIFRRRDFS